MGLEGIFPFSALFGAFLRFLAGISPFWALFFAFLRFILETGKMGNFTPTPSAPTPLRTSRIKLHKAFVLWTGISCTNYRSLMAEVPQISEILHDRPGASHRTTILGISGVEFSWRFVGFSRLPIIALAQGIFSHSLSQFHGFSRDFRGPTNNRVSGTSGVLSWPFRGCQCPASGREYAQACCLGKQWREPLS